jgi:hypothetical protein
MTTKSFMTDLVVDSAVADDLIVVLTSASGVDRQVFVSAETVTDLNVIKTMFRSEETRC